MDLKIIQQKLVGNDEERAVSPVIGVILMVAITVILAAVIAAFVLDLGDTSDPAPTTTFDYSLDSDWDGDDPNTTLLHISHSGGNAVEFDDLRLVIRDDSGASIASIESSDWEDSVGDNTDYTNFMLEYDNANPTGEEFSVGDSATLIADNSTASAPVNSNDDLEVEIIHEPSNSLVSSHEFQAP